MGLFLFFSFAALVVTVRVSWYLLLVVVGVTIGVIALVRAAVQRMLAPPEPPIAVHVPSPRPAKDPVAAWRAAHRRFTVLTAEYSSYECDPLAVLRLPALADVTVPATARFVDAFAEAQALHTDALPPADHAEAYQRAVDRAERAWTAARDAAQRIQLAGLSPEERATVERVIKLLTVAKESANDAERLAAYGKARAELTKLERSGRIRLPRPAAAHLEEAARPGLPAPPPSMQPSASHPSPLAAPAVDPRAEGH